MKLKIWHIIDLFDELMEHENRDALMFIKEQLNLLITSKNNLNYFSHFMTFACLLHSISPHANKFIRHYGSFILPHPILEEYVIHLICHLNLSRQMKKCCYIRGKIPHMSDNDKLGILLIDEIHLKSLIIKVAM